MIRQFITYFTLLLFLFPMIEQGIHAFGHEEEEHCAEYEETHLHEKHHDCKLCDFNVEPLIGYNSDLKNIHLTFYFEFDFNYHSFSDSFTHHFFSLRAPPKLV